MALITSAPFILASASPRRIELLSTLGLAFTAMPSGADESCRVGESPTDHVRRVACMKARALAMRHPDAWILGADTIVAVDGEVLGKPKNAADARRMLRLLRGRTHHVYTGFAVIRKSVSLMRRKTVRSTVLFSSIGEDEVEWYIRTGEPYGKAGGYAIQGKGGVFVRRISGSYSNVIGLPINEIFEILKKIGAIHFDEGCGEQVG
ncbi:MAG: nucleoside triphosphate pyrophosphatase [Syntrophales bacterium]|jgi:septum formation protein|nr:nucleoside triphosphate pyrophosphatase [Syntrophales bacterium]